MIGYDLDGVLATGPAAADKPWGRMNGAERRQRQADLLSAYRTATPLLEPEGPFVAISARKDDPAIREATTEWLLQRYPTLLRGLYLLPVARTINNVVAFKAAAIQHAGVTAFTEDNREVLAGLAAQDLPVQLWFWKAGMNQPTPYERKPDA